MSACRLCCACASAGYNRARSSDALGHDGCEQARKYAKTTAGKKVARGELKEEFGSSNRHASNLMGKDRACDRQQNGITAANAPRQRAPLSFPPGTHGMLHDILLERSSNGLLYSKAGGLFDLSLREEAYAALLEHIRRHEHLRTYEASILDAGMQRVKTALNDKLKPWCTAYGLQRTDLPATVERFCAEDLNEACPVCGHVGSFSKDMQSGYLSCPVCGTVVGFSTDPVFD